MTEPQGVTTVAGPLANGLGSRVRRLLGEGAALTVNHVLFAAAAVLVTSGLVREAGSQVAAAVLAAYAVESLVVTASRGYFVVSPVFRHETLTRLCRGDVTFAVRRLSLITCATWPFLSGVAYWLSGNVAVSVMAGFWASSLMLGDVARTMNATFSTGKSAVLSMVLYTAGTGVVAACGPLVGVELLLGASGGLSLLLAGTSFTLLARTSEPGGCGYWRREAQFSRALAGEGAGAVLSLTAAQLLIARLAPQEMVALQIANQVVASPALLLVNGMSVPLIRRAQRRRSAGRSELSILFVWAGANVALLIVAWLAAIAVTPLLDQIFGAPWSDARDLLLPLAGYAAAVACVQTFLTRYRTSVSPRSVRRAFLAILALGQIPQVASVAYDWPGGLGTGLLAGATAVLAVAFVQFMWWERSRATER